MQIGSKKANYFVNICCSEKIGLPKTPDGKTNVGRVPPKFLSIPLSVGPIRTAKQPLISDHKDSTKVPYCAVDVVFHPIILQRMTTGWSLLFYLA